MKIGIIGLGFVGGAMKKSFIEKGIPVIGFDKYKDGGIGSIESCLKTDILFLSLPTPFDSKDKKYNKDALNEVLGIINDDYKGIVVIKSTVEPETSDRIADEHPGLQILHNPEFLSSRTAYQDFHNQKHIVIGRTRRCEIKNQKRLKDFYAMHYPDAEITLCSANESECMKIFCNSYYAVKIQFFNELYLLSKSIGCDYNRIKDMMLKNGWINPMHTDVPGPDGKLSYGGACFPKDTNALLEYMKMKNTPSNVIESAIDERNKMRPE